MMSRSTSMKNIGIVYIYIYKLPTKLRSNSELTALIISESADSAYFMKEWSGINDSSINYWRSGTYRRPQSLEVCCLDLGSPPSII